MEYKVIPSTMCDIEQIMKMFDNSRNIMRNNGNFQQWVNGYPSREILLDDIKNGHSFVIEYEGRMVGTFAFIIGRDPTYDRIEQGDWLEDDNPYGTIHRLACVPGVHGIAHTAFTWAAAQVKQVRADTHHSNTIMRHVLQKFGFSYRGVIYVSDGTPRDAYQYFS